MRNISSDAAVLNSAKNELADKVSYYRAILHKTDNDLDAVMAKWKGTASKALLDLMGEWKERANKTNDSLDRITTAVGEGNKRYIDVDEDNVNDFKAAYTNLD